MSAYASAAEGLRHVFLRDLDLAARIGVHPHEHAAAQRVRINLDLAVEDPGASGAAPPVGAWWITRRWRPGCAPSRAPATCGWSKRWRNALPWPASITNA